MQSAVRRQDEPERHRQGAGRILVTEILIDAVAPTNAMLTNPAAVRKFVDTGGRSLWSGLKNYFDDLAKNGGMPSMVDQRRLQGRRNFGDHPGWGGVP